MVVVKAQEASRSKRGRLRRGKTGPGCLKGGRERGMKATQTHWGMNRVPEEKYTVQNSQLRGQFNNPDKLNSESLWVPVQTTLIQWPRLTWIHQNQERGRKRIEKRRYNLYWKLWKKKGGEQYRIQPIIPRVSLNWKGGGGAACFSPKARRQKKKRW